MNRGQHNVYVVDGQATAPPPIPFRQRRRQRRAGVAQTLLILLVSLALCGMAIEACLIYHLYHPKSVAASPPFSRLSGDENIKPPSMWLGDDSPPLKPMAHLTGGVDAVHGPRVMAWSTIAEPVLHDMTYEGRSLIVRTAGYYYVYSKVAFAEGIVFYHTVKRNTDRYPGDNITLLMAKKYSPKHGAAQSNSYLGGVFQLSGGDAIFVEVSNTNAVRGQEASENVFGVFMV